MRILFVNQYFPPDSASTASLLGELCEDLAARGHEVYVVAGLPSYNPTERRRMRMMTRERWRGVRVTRTFSTAFARTSNAGRLLNYVTFLASALFGCLRAPRPDVVVVMTDPPVVGAVAWAAARIRRAPMVSWCQDIVPEAWLALGWLRPGRVATWLGRVSRFSLLRSSAVIAIGEDMRDRLVVKGAPRERVFVVPNWSDSSCVFPTDGDAFRSALGLNGGLLVMHSGNIGMSQDLDAAIDAMAMLAPGQAKFAIVGDGAGKAALEERVRREKLDNVFLLPYQKKEHLAESLSAADLHLVSLRRGLAGYVVPSKVYGIMAAGRAFVAAVDSDSEVAEIVRRHGCGVLVEPEDPASLADAVRELTADPEEMQRLGRQGREALLAHYDRPLAATRFEAVFRAVATR